ncbi:hypothetical protein EGW08_011156 [Elysia chlorotica]|uniref:DNA-3-methyladenine glycosylase n=1 Tax=Elysia chlorotica TaxID=188477 RepID=A0A3S1B6N2_ELYCH|nr:hypothetical protein EGW08_011156 [Elysia chlorotica]
MYKSEDEKNNGKHGPSRLKRAPIDSLKNNRASKSFKSDSVSAQDQSPMESQTASREESVRLQTKFFDVPCAQLAIDLLGKKLVRKSDSQMISGMIVETEAYLGLEDKAAHSYQGKRTERNEAMFMPPGTAYVYNIYGMYCCFNISSAGEGCAVLLRALEPLEGLEEMHEMRKKSPNKKLKDKDLTNGPAKLCQALKINKDKFNKIDLTSSDELWLENGEDIPQERIVQCPRIHIGYAEEWVEKPLRFYIKENPCVSVKYKG